VRRRLLISYLSITALVLILLEVPLGLAFASAERRHLETTQQHDAFLLALHSEELLRQGASSRAKIQQLAERYRDAHGGHVVFVDADGRRIADSSVSSGEVPSDRRLARQPEIKRALSGRDSTGERYSRAAGDDIVYVAIPIESDGRLYGVVRITHPFSLVEERIRERWYLLGGVGVVVLLVVSVVSVVVSRSIARPIAEMEQGAIGLGQGNLATRVEVPDGPPELRSLARSFNSTAARLEQLVDAQQEFVADASHQLRTPLAALQFRLENLARSTAGEGLDDVEGAQEEVDRLSVLVDGLLELARAGQVEAAPERIDARALVEGRRDAWAALAEERGVGIAVDASEAFALATPGHLEQVLDNLLNNALDASPPGSTIRLFASRGGEVVRLGVADEGPGLSDDQRARAFDRFWRARGEDSGGFGLGLAIVRQLVVADGGDVVLGPAVSGGLEVIVTMPAAPPSPG